MTDHYRIAMIAACPLPCPRGTPVRIFRLAEALTRRGHEVHVISYHLGDDEPRPSFPIHRIASVPRYRRTDPGPTWPKLLVLDPLLALKTRRVLARHRFDVIHAHHVEGLLAGYAGRGLRRLGLVFDAHTCLARELPHYRVGLSRRLMGGAGVWGDRALPRLASHVVAVSDEIARALAEAGMPEDRISVAPNGVNVEPFLELDAPQPPEDGVVAFTGNLASYQGLDLLLRAMVDTVAMDPRARLRIVTSDQATWPRDMAGKLGIAEHVELIRAGFDCVPGELRRAILAVSPRTDCDGVPQKILNYMASGRPVVAFAGSARHIEHEVNGLVVPNGDVEAMAKAIVRLLAAPDEARRMGEAGRRLVQERLSWNHTAEQVEAVYQRVVHREPAGSTAPPPTASPTLEPPHADGAPK